MLLKDLKANIRETVILRLGMKVFEPFEDLSKPSSSIDAMIVSYGCAYKRSS